VISILFTKIYYISSAIDLIKLIFETDNFSKIIKCIEQVINNGNLNLINISVINMLHTMIEYCSILPMDQCEDKELEANFGFQIIFDETGALKESKDQKELPKEQGLVQSPVRKRLFNSKFLGSSFFSGEHLANLLLILNNLLNQFSKVSSKEKLFIVRLYSSLCLLNIESINYFFIKNGIIKILYVK